MAEKDGEWTIRRILKTKTDVVNGKKVLNALVDWEPSWVPVSDLSSEDKNLLEDRHITVIGPLDVQKKDMPSQSAVGFERECREWLCRKGTPTNGVFFVESYNKLRAKFPEALLDFFESRIQYRVTNSKVITTQSLEQKEKEAAKKRKNNENDYLSDDKSEASGLHTPTRSKEKFIISGKLGPSPTVKSARRRPLSSSSMLSENL